MPTDENQRVLALLEQLSDLCNLFALSMMMSDGRGEREIMELAVTSVSSLTSCRSVAGLLGADPQGLRTPEGSPLVWPELMGQLADLDGVEGPIGVPDAVWARAFPLQTTDGNAGYLVMAADADLSPDQLLLLRMLAQQTGRAVTTAALRRRDLATAAELRTLNTRLSDLNDRLGASVADLEQRRKVHEMFSEATAAGGGEAGITATLYELTGLPAAAEDRFGNLRAWSGPHRVEPYPQSSPQERAALLADVGRSPVPVRHRDRLIALAQSRDEVLGVLALVDPGHRASGQELFALEHGAVMLCVELAHQRTLAEAELRLRRDLVDDLLSGTDDDSALSRSQALGHDLRPEHQVAVVRWPHSTGEDALARAVEQAVPQVMDTGVLLARRPGGLVLIAPGPAASEHRRRWTDLYGTVARSLRGAAGAIGVGGTCARPSQLSRSFAEADRALGVRLRSADPKGVTLYEELGIYRLLASGEDDEVRRYIREWLGPLLDYDADSRSDLVSTLWQYLECGGNYDATARALLIHRSTLRYRLRRIREISGLDLGAVNTRLNLHVATRAWQVMQGQS